MSITANMFNVPLTAILKPLQDLVGGLPSSIVLSADETAVSSNTLTAQSGLSRDVISGVVYSLTIVVWLIATSAEGWKIDLNGGSATMSWIKGGATGYDFLLSDGTANPNASLALMRGIDALTTNLSPQDGWSGMVEIKGSFEPSSDGTFIPRIAQTAHSAGSVQVLKGSSIEVR